MPLNEYLQKYRGWIENGFWVALLIIAYIAMQKLMHPGWTIFGF